MKLKKYIALPLAAALCMSLAACGNSSGTASMAASAAPSAVSSVVSEAIDPEASTEPEKVILPLESFGGTDLTFSMTDPMADGEYSAVSFGENAIEEHDVGFHITVTFYNYDRYSFDDINALKVGDSIRTHTGNGDETQDLKVESLENGAQYFVVNGGAEHGGMNLARGENVVSAYGANGFPVYYPVGEAMLPLADDVVLYDSPTDTETTGDAAVAEAITGDEAGFSCENTSLTIQNGQITKITRWRNSSETMKGN